MKQARQLLPAGDDPQGGAVWATLTLAFDERRRSRRLLRVGGEEVALVLPRGTVLRDGDRLLVEGGPREAILAVRAAPEPLSSVETADGFLLARAAYHLGNRHVPLELAPGRLRYQRDAVLDDMVRALGLEPLAVEAPFQPEAGPYAQEPGGPAPRLQAHAHRHGHHHHHQGHDHDQGFDHDHDRDHDRLAGEHHHDHDVGPGER
jgi:urease accessory protein